MALNFLWGPWIRSIFLFFAFKQFIWNATSNLILLVCCKRNISFRRDLAVETLKKKLNIKRFQKILNISTIWNDLKKFYKKRFHKYFERFQKVSKHFTNNDFIKILKDIKQILKILKYYTQILMISQRLEPDFESDNCKKKQLNTG